jgi:hypothetical protein
VLRQNTLTMLKTLDILIGLSVVMLFVSMIVTVVTQFIITQLQMRGKHLLSGIADLLAQIDPNMPRQAAEEIAGAILSHPLISEANGKLGSVIHREELTKFLLELGSTDGPQQLSQEAKQHLVNALASNGAGTPDQIRQTLQNVRSLALQLELAHPELTNAARARIAILQQANSQLIGKVNLWFDQTMDRVSGRFTANTRWVTFTVGLLIALVMQLDTAALVSRLSIDESARNDLINRATVRVVSTASAAQPNIPANPTQDSKANDAKGAVQANPASDHAFDLTDADKRAVRDLMTNNILGFPTSFDDWAKRWSWQNSVMKSIGILLTAVLLSLGAPFWYNALQNLVRLRSVIASKDDQQRQERQLSVPTATATAAAAAAGSADAALLGDERGDLAAVA